MEKKEEVRGWIGRQRLESMQDSSIWLSSKPPFAATMGDGSGIEGMVEECPGSEGRGELERKLWL